jgi:hypothetical protein
VLLHRLLRDPETVCDLAIRPADRQFLEDLALTAREPDQALDLHVVHDHRSHDEDVRVARGRHQPDIDRTRALGAIEPAVDRDATPPRSFIGKAGPEPLEKWRR